MTPLGDQTVGIPSAQPNHGMQPTRNKPRAADAWPLGILKKAVGT
jgi:hypothetical protein